MLTVSAANASMWTIASMQNLMPPFYTIELRATAVGTTHTGLKINTEAQVIGKNGQPIPGLYCAGECAGRVMKNYVGGGNSLLNCFVYGRVAGKNAALLAKSGI